MLTFARILAAALVASTLPACGLASKAKDGDSNANNAPGTGSTPVTPSEQGSGGPQPSPLALTGALVSFPTCADVEARIEQDEVDAMKRSLQDQIRWVSSADDGGTASKTIAMPEAAADTVAPASASAGNSASAPSAHTGTNNQVEGVEEGDFVKNDGTHVFHISRGKLHVLKSWPAADIAEVAKLDLDGSAFDLLLDEDKKRLVVLAHPRMTAAEIQAESIRYGSASEKVMADSAPAGDAASLPMPRFNYEQVEALTVDVADPAAPKVTGRYRLRGSHLASRRIGSAVRLVLRSWRPYDPSIKYYLDYSESQKLDQAGRVARLNELIAQNEAAIRAKDLSYWLGLGDDFKEDAGGARTPLADPGSCANVHASSVSTAAGVTRVASIDLDAGTVAETVLLSHVDEVYASTENLYLATRYYWWSSADRDSDATFIHKFSIKDAGVAPYIATGRVEGMPLNQFSFDEFEGRLRVATTTTGFGGGTPVAAIAALKVAAAAPTGPVNRVAVLEQSGAELKQVGITPDMAPGERIMSARFSGPRAFVVTFRQVDPLFAIDLANPAAPAVRGALKIPGYSSYLHFTDETHLLAVGRSGTEAGLNGGIKVALFDVADLSAPKEVQSLTLGGSSKDPDPTDDFYSGSSFWSEAEWDHKAFTYFPEKKLLALPVTGHTYWSSPRYWWSKFESGLFVFSVDAGAGIKTAGKLSMNGLYDGPARDESFWFGGARVNRSFFADDFVYGISDFGVRAANVADLAAPVGAVKYKCDEDCYRSWYWWAAM